MAPTTRLFRINQLHHCSQGIAYRAISVDPQHGQVAVSASTVVPQCRHSMTVSVRDRPGSIRFTVVSMGRWEVGGVTRQQQRGGRGVPPSATTLRREAHIGHRTAAELKPTEGIPRQHVVIPPSDKNGRTDKTQMISADQVVPPYESMMWRSTG